MTSSVGKAVCLAAAELKLNRYENGKKKRLEVLPGAKKGKKSLVTNRGDAVRVVVAMMVKQNGGENCLARRYDRNKIKG